MEMKAILMCVANIFQDSLNYIYEDETIENLTKIMLEQIETSINIHNRIPKVQRMWNA